MRAAELTEFLIKSIVKDDTTVSVNGFDTEEEYVSD